MALSNAPRPSAQPHRKEASGSVMGGFRINQDAAVHRLIVNIEGLQKAGKNHFAFTAPGDIAVQSFDIGLEGVVEKFNKDKRIYSAEYELHEEADLKNASAAVQAEAERLWNKFASDYRDACATDSIRTIVWDTGTEVWELLRLKNFGKLSANSQHYSEVNAEFRRLFRVAYDYEKNFACIHQLKAEWKEGASGKSSKTGRFERAGFKEIEFMVQVNMRFWKDEGVAGPNGIHAVISDCRQNPEVNGVQLDAESGMLNWQTLGSMVFPESPESAWI